MVKEIIKVFLINKLHLELNKKSRYFCNELGVEFLGFKIFNTHILVKKSNKNKMKKRIKNYNKLYKKGKIDKHYVLLSVNSWVSHVSHASSYNLVKNVLSKIDFDYQYCVK